MLCSTCAQDLPAADFYKTNKSVCRECVKIRERARRNSKIDEVRAYDRKRGLDENRKKAVAARAPRYKHLDAERTRKYRARHPEKAKAMSALSRALRTGQLSKPLGCQACGKQARLEGHHHDYSKPSEVTWLCRQCHGAEHRRLNEEKRKSP